MEVDDEKSNSSESGTGKNNAGLIISGSVADPDPGLGTFLTPGSGIRDGRKSASGSGNEQPGSYFLELRNHFFGFFGGQNT